MTARGVGLKHLTDFIAHAAEDEKLLLFGAGGVGGVVKAPVVAVYLAGKHGAGLIGIAADGDDGFNVLIEELIEVLGMMRGDVDADLGHDFDGEGMDVAGGLGAGAGDGVAFTQDVAEDAFGEVGAAGVAGAEDEDGGLFHG